MPHFIALFAGASLLLGPAPDEPRDGDLSGLQGTWREENVGVSKDRRWTLTIEGRRFTWTNQVQADDTITTEMKGHVELRESTEPKGIELAFTEDSRGRKLPPLSGIYKLEGGDLVIRFVKERTAEFDEASPAQHRLKRVKDAG